MLSLTHAHNCDLKGHSFIKIAKVVSPTFIRTFEFYSAVNDLEINNCNQALHCDRCFPDISQLPICPTLPVKTASILPDLKGVFSQLPKFWTDCWPLQKSLCLIPILDGFLHVFELIVLLGDPRPLKNITPDSQCHARVRHPVPEAAKQPQHITEPAPCGPSILSLKYSYLNIDTVRFFFVFFLLFSFLPKKCVLIYLQDIVLEGFWLVQMFSQVFLCLLAILSSSWFSCCTV